MCTVLVMMHISVWIGIVVPMTIVIVLSTVAIVFTAVTVILAPAVTVLAAVVVIVPIAILAVMVVSIVPAAPLLAVVAPRLALVVVARPAVAVREAILRYNGQHMCVLASGGRTGKKGRKGGGWVPSLFLTGIPVGRREELRSVPWEELERGHGK